MMFCLIPDRVPCMAERVSSLTGHDLIHAEKKEEERGKKERSYA